MPTTKKASHEGTLKIGDLTIPCAVVDGKRYLSSRGVVRALGASTTGYHYKRRKASSDAVELPIYLSFPNLKPFIDKGLATALKTPERYYPARGGGAPAVGLPAELLPAVCDVWLKARKAGDVPRRQEHIAAAAEIIVRGLAHIGIIALVDEATGYQEIRDRQALQDLLDRFMRAEYAKWAKTFPDEFYQNLFRLKGWQYRPLSVKRPQVVGHWTNDLIYSRLAPGVLTELKQLNPKTQTGTRARRHFQWLTDDYGIPALRQHLQNVIFLMRGSTKWERFYRALNRAAPKQEDTINLMLPGIEVDDASDED